MRYNVVKTILFLALSYFANAEFDENEFMPKTVEVQSKTTLASKQTPTTVAVPVKIRRAEESITTKVLFKDTTDNIIAQELVVPKDVDDIAIICKNYDNTNPEDLKSPETVCDYDMNCFKLYNDFLYMGTTGYYWEHDRTYLDDKCFVYTSRKSDPKPKVSEYTTPIDICRGEIHVSTGVYDSLISYVTTSTILNNSRSLSAYTMYFSEKPMTVSSTRCKPYTNEVGPITSTTKTRAPTTIPISTIKTTTTSKPLPANMKTMLVNKVVYDDFYFNGPPEIKNVVEDVITVPVEVKKAYVECTTKYPPVMGVDTTNNMMASAPSSGVASSGTKSVPSLARRANDDIVSWLNGKHDHPDVICDQEDKKNCYKFYDETSESEAYYKDLTYEKEKCYIYTQLEEKAIPTTSVMYTSLCKPTTETLTETSSSYLGQTCTSYVNDVKTRICTNSYDIYPKTSLTIKCVPATTTEMVKTTTTTTRTTTVNAKTTTIITITKTTKAKSTTTTVNNDGKCSGKYAQCGGIGYTGTTCCQSGLTCKKMSEYYSQCV